MFSFTHQERQVILFLVGMALIGLGVNFAVKKNACIATFMSVDNDMGKVDINRASYEDLTKVKGITESLAKNIIEYRNKHGTFTYLEELKEVKGIKEFRFNKIKGYLIIK